MKSSAPRDEAAGPERRVGRRQLLQGSAVALGGAGVGWAGAAAASAAAPGNAPVARAATETIVLSPSAGSETVPFHGPHQAGVATPAQSHLCLLGLDLLEELDRDGLGRLLRVLSDDASRLSRGAPALADTEPELAENPSRLTVTFGLGPRVLGVLAEADRPALDPLPPFRTDRLQPEWGQTDLAIQICGDDLTTVAHARRMLTKDARSFARVRWVQEGFRGARGSDPQGTTMRNVMGQVDGTVNPAEADADFAGLVWADAAGAGFAGGTFMVVRRIRARMSSWDKVDRSGREFAIGRTLDTGAPLTGTDEFDEPDFEATDATGFPVIDAASHIRRARSDDPDERFLRRGYNYAVLTPDGEEDSGLVFIAFAADLERQFVPIQRRLAQQDRLNQWVTSIGSAVYAVPPGAPEGGFVGMGLVGG